MTTARVLDATADLTVVECPRCQRAFGIPRRAMRPEQANSRVCPGCHEVVIGIEPCVVARVYEDAMPPWNDPRQIRAVTEADDKGL